MNRTQHAIALIAEGMSVRAAARAVGLSHGGLRAGIKRAAAARAEAFVDEAAARVDLAELEFGLAIRGRVDAYVHALLDQLHVEGLVRIDNLFRAGAARDADTVVAGDTPPGSATRAPRRRAGAEKPSGRSRVRRPGPTSRSRRASGPPSPPGAQARVARSPSRRVRSTPGSGELSPASITSSATPASARAGAPPSRPPRARGDAPHPAVAPPSTARARRSDSRPACRVCGEPGHNARTCSKRAVSVPAMSPPAPAREDIARTDSPPRALQPAELMPAPRPPARACRKCEGATGPWAGLDLCVKCLRAGLAARKAEREAAAVDVDQVDERDDDIDHDDEPTPVRGELPTPTASFSMGGGL